MKREIKLANPRGFCAGVDRAIEIVNQALLKFGPPVYVRHEVVHNRNVVEDLKSKGAIFVEQIDEIPEGAITIFSAHGVSKKVVDDAEIKNLNYFDATCPLVTKVHMEVIRFARQGLDIILVGHDNHPEVEGTLGRFPHDSKGKIYLVESEIDAKNIEIEYNISISEIWSVGSSGTLTRGLQMAFPDKEVNVVSVGHKMKQHEIGRANLYLTKYKFMQEVKKEDKPPFPSVPTYDAKAWAVMKQYAKKGALFWNVGK